MIRISNIRRIANDGTCRVCAEVNGVDVWYESPGAELLASPEVFSCAFLLPAMKAGATLCVEGALSRVWKTNAQKLMELFHSWWGYPVVGIDAGDAPVAPVMEGGRTALFFSGGVDSFHSLLRGGQPVEDLIYVYGFDLSLDDEQRFADVMSSLESVAKATGRRLLTIKTNLRQHPLMGAMDWGWTHGGALASAAYSLPGTARVVISSSFSRMASHPWGSHWQADPFWSSERLEVVHQGDHVYRSDKLQQMVDEPLVQQNLRVCWQNQKTHLNCCRCEKCVRTMLLLETCGKLDSYDVFPLRHQLLQMVRGVPSVPMVLIPVYQDFVRRGLPRQTARAVHALLLRTRLLQIRRLLKTIAIR